MPSQNWHFHEILVFKMCGFSECILLDLQIALVFSLFQTGNVLRIDLMSLSGRPRNYSTLYPELPEQTWLLLDSRNRRRERQFVSIIDHRSYPHKLSSCEIKAWIKFYLPLLVSFTLQLQRDTLTEYSFFLKGQQRWTRKVSITGEEASLLVAAMWDGDDWRNMAEHCRDQ